MICRIERGQLGDVRVGVMHRLFEVLAIRYRLDTELPNWQRPQRDFVHARCVAYASRRLSSAGWLVDREVEVGGDRSHGWIDILAFHPGSRTLLVIEVKTEIHDLGAIERSLNWYRREAAQAARARGWRPTSIRSALLLLESRANDDRVIALGPALALGFPRRARALRLLVDGADDRDAEPFLAMLDPRSRRAAWLQATRSDGRRTVAPFVDYIDAARKLEHSPGRVSVPDVTHGSVRHQ
jgi:hypothetical protein